MSRFLHTDYQNLEAYTPGEQPRGREFIKLNTNESPYPPSAGVIAAVNEKEVRDLRLYSDPTCRALREAIAGLYGVKPENIFLSNGSDDILNFAFMAFCGDKREAAYADITYGFYEVFAELHRISSEVIPLKEDLSLDWREYFGKNKLTVIANPNAPTGKVLTPAEIEEILKSNPDNVVVIDEAYVDFGAESVYPLTATYDNLLVVQTFSKSRSMAGARLGFAIASEALIADLDLLCYSTNPYNVNRLTLAAGCAAIADNDYYMDNCKKIMSTRARTAKALQAMGFEVTDSLANFLFAKSDKIGGEELYLKLKEKGILVRHFTKPRIAEYNRITIGTDAEMDALLSSIEEILKEKNK